MTFIDALKTWPEDLAVPICRYCEVTDRIMSELYKKIEEQLPLVSAFKTDEANPPKNRLQNMMRVLESVRGLVKPTDEVRACWKTQGAAFTHQGKKPGEGAEFLKDFVLYSRRWKESNPNGDELVLHYILVVAMCLRGFSREDIFSLHMPEIDQRHFTYLSLIFDRLPMALKDLEDTSVVVREYYPEDDSPLDVGQYGFDIRGYDEVRQAAARLNEAETALLAMIVRQYRRRLEERFPDLTVFQYALRRMGSEGIVSVSMKAVPIIQQLAEDIAPDIPEGKELQTLLKEGFVDPILAFRSRSILRYATTQSWALASFLRIVNLHLVFVLDEKRDLSATEFLDFIYNDSIDEATIRKNLSKENGLTESVAQNLSALRQLAPRAMVRALSASFETVVPLMEVLAKDAVVSIAERFKGTPVEHFDDEGVRQLLEGVKRFTFDFKKECPRESMPSNDEAALLAIVSAETPELKTHITETCEKLSDHDAREAFRALIAFWSVAVVLMRGAVVKGEIPDGMNRDTFDTNFRFIIVGVSDLIRRFDIIDLPKEDGHTTEFDGENGADGNNAMPPPSMIN